MDFNTLFCEEIENITDEEMAWLLDQVDPGKGEKSVFVAFTEEQGELTFTVYKEGESAIIEADEAGNPKEVAVLMSAFLARFRPDETWVMEYAHTASRSAVGVYGGGGVIVTKDGARYMDSSTFVIGQYDRRLEPVTAALRHIERRWGHKFNNEDWDIFDAAIKPIEQGGTNAPVDL